MDFEKNVPDWNAAGTEPPSSLKESGFQAGYKPPAAYFNWFWNGVSACLTEIRTKLSGTDTALTTHKHDTANPHNVTVSQIGAAPAAFYVTLGGNADDGYTTDKTFAEIMAACNEGRQVILIENAYGAIVEYKLQYVYSDEIDFSYHKGIYNTVIEVYAHGVVTRKNYQYFSDRNPPSYDDVGAEPLGAVHNHNTDGTAHADIRTLASTAQSTADAHIASTSNPHGVTAAQVGAPTVAEMNAAIAAIPTPDVSGQIATHNTDTAAHADIRTELANKAPAYQYSTTDLTAGTSTLETGTLYFVYE